MTERDGALALPGGARLGQVGGIPQPRGGDSGRCEGDASVRGTSRAPLSDSGRSGLGRPEMLVGVSSVGERLSPGSVAVLSDLMGGYASFAICGETEDCWTHVYPS